MRLTKKCLLCGDRNTDLFFEDEIRHYFRCPSCSLVFVPPEEFLCPVEEKKRYDLHQNSPDDKRYREFLGRLFNPLREKLPTGSKGLDFGSGPGPTLSLMFKEAGYPMTIYDAFYAKNPEALREQYDFITATETLEHVHNPKKELDQLWACLRPHGWLGIMTKLVLGKEKFSKWHYKNDPTHVSFFSRETFEWLATERRAKLVFADSDVILLHKVASPF